MKFEEVVKTISADVTTDLNQQEIKELVALSYLMTFHRSTFKT